MTVAQTDNTIMINQTLGTNLGFELVLISGMDGELWIIWMNVCFSYHPKKLKSKQLLFRQKAISNRIFYAIPICTISCNPHSDFEKSRLLRHHRDPCASWSFATPRGSVGLKLPRKERALSLHVAKMMLGMHELPRDEFMALWKVKNGVISMRGGHKHTETKHCDLGKGSATWNRMKPPGAHWADSARSPGFLLRTALFKAADFDGSGRLDRGEWLQAWPCHRRFAWTFNGFKDI